MTSDAVALVRSNISWKRAFSAAVLQRGQRYAEEDRVQILDHDDRRIEATCRGSGSGIYTQRIFITAAAGQCHVRGHCSCPVRELQALCCGAVRPARQQRAG